MLRQRKCFIMIAITIGVVMVYNTTALGLYVQEKCYNNTGQAAYELTKIVVGEGIVTRAIDNQLGSPSITPHTPVGGGAPVSIIHWGPGGTPVPNGDWVWGCFSASGSPQLGSASWEDSDGNFIGRAAVEVTVNASEVGDDIRVGVEHTWREWTGTGYPPEPEDDFGDPLGPITGTDVYYAITDHRRTLEDLNEDLYNDPEITWVALPDFLLSNAGDTDSYNLGELEPSDIVLLRFVASGEGISTPTIHQLQPNAPIPTLSQWGLIVMAGLLLTVGAIVIRRRLKTVPA